jgi:hypothetical protein
MGSVTIVVDFFNGSAQDKSNENILKNKTMIIYMKKESIHR